MATPLFYQNPLAQMGFVGYVQFDLPGITGITDVTVPDPNAQAGRYKRQARVTSCSLQLKQDADRLNQAKSPAFPYSSPYFDRMLYTMKPETIDGDIEYPLIAYDATIPALNFENFDPTPDLWNMAVRRNYQERLNSFDTLVKYSNFDKAFRYKDCLVNDFTFSVRERDVIKVKVNLWAKSRSQVAYYEDVDSTRHVPVMSRILTWADAIMSIYGQFGIIDGRYIRTFEAKVNNNLERFFTAGASVLQVRDIMPKLRNIEGSMTLWGRHPPLAQYSRDNPTHCTEEAMIDFGYYARCTKCIGTENPTCVHGSSQVVMKAYNVVFLIEELNLTNDLFETVVKWYSLPADKDLTISFNRIPVSVS